MKRGFVWLNFYIFLRGMILPCNPPATLNTSFGRLSSISGRGTGSLPLFNSEIFSGFRLPRICFVKIMIDSKQFSSFVFRT